MSISTTDLERQLKSVTKTGKYVVGRKEVLGSLKGSKLVVWSASANVPPQILSECKTLQVPAIRFDGNPIELGKACGIPYKVSVIAVKSPGDATLSPFEGSKDYSEQTSMFQTKLVVRQERAEEGRQPVSDLPKKKKQRGEGKEEAEEKTGRSTKEKGTTTKAKRGTRKKVADGEEEGSESKKSRKKETKTAKKPSKKSTTTTKKSKKKDDEVEVAESEAVAEEDTDEEAED